MPISTRIDQQKKIVYSTCTGAMSAEEVAQWQSSVWKDPQIEGYHRLVDMREIDFSDYTFSDVLETASRAVALDRGSRPGKLAYVVNTDAQEEVVRFYFQAMSMLASPRDPRIFRDYDEAIAWISD